MINRETVFILGAGASAPYSYPVGSKLYNDIASSPHTEDIIQAYLSRQGEDIPPDERQDVMGLIKDFREKLHSADFDSIDFFLEHNQKYLEIGKILIAHIMIRFECPENIYGSSSNWYSYLFNSCMRASFDDLPNNKVSFVTFNYDRSLEHYLFNVLKNGFVKSDEEVRTMLKNFPIIHLYGSLGPLLWQSKNGFDYVSGKKLINRYISAKENINIIGEKRKEHFKDANELISKAQRICFLGFGYSRDNLNKLDLSLMQGKEVFGTAYDLGDAEIDAVKRYFKEKDVLIQLGFTGHDCLSYLRKNFVRDL